MRYLQISSYLILFLLFHFGCASYRPLGNIPTDQKDFNLSKDDIRAKFPEVAIYDKKGFKDVLGRCTPIQELVSLWGEPDKKKNDWFRYHIPAFGAIAVGGIAGGGVVGTTVGTGIVLGIAPAPFQTYTWHKGNYTINVNTDLSIFCGYKRRLIYWEWVPDF